MGSKRKIHAVTVTVYVEQTGRPALPTRTEITDGLIRHLTGQEVTVNYGSQYLAQDMAIIGVYGNLATDDSAKKGPDILSLRSSVA